MRIPGIEQVQVHDEFGMGFGKALRAFLRQDPNVIMVGEIRDEETDEIACRAALVGRLVLSTLHTNSPEDAEARLVDLGVPKYIVVSVLRGVPGQRLDVGEGGERRLSARLHVPELSQSFLCIRHLLALFYRSTGRCIGVLRAFCQFGEAEFGEAGVWWWRSRVRLSMVVIVLVCRRGVSIDFAVVVPRVFDQHCLTFT
ncbi:ATPase, T2SS/T4P/T4SS family [Aliiroseovarius sp. 2305UL8-7]|uniref:ATPase, T2SS/T4P/T4SS family n=1 Tax=Aliiroseovarius conchicola TaxID=3121637 RepID=UPI0035287F47